VTLDCSFCTSRAHHSYTATQPVTYGPDSLGLCGWHARLLLWSLGQDWTD